MTAVVALMAGDKGDPEIKFQVLFWPATDADLESASSPHSMSTQRKHENNEELPTLSKTDSEEGPNLQSLAEIY